ncbi:hypothetical protein ACP70R_041970 [Stipagrostis hirtigluma subsp. patula]
MAVDHSRKRTRFPFLATVRHTVAILVILFTVVMVTMVITAAVRPAHIRLSVLQGRVRATSLWSRRPYNLTITAPYTGRGRPYSGRGVGVVSIHSGGIRPLPELTRGRPCPRCSGPYYSRSNLPRLYDAQKLIRLRVTLSAYNPSGRADIDCKGVTLRVFDMPDLDDGRRFDYLAATAGRVEIGEFHLPDFAVKRQAAHTLRRWLPVNDTAALQYIASRYGGMSSFTAMLQVTATISYASNVPIPSEHVNMFCWPVTVVGGVVDYGSRLAPAVTCKSNSDLLGALAPAPAPAVAAG